MKTIANAAGLVIVAAAVGFGCTSGDQGDPVDADSAGSLRFSLAFPPEGDVENVAFEVINLATGNVQTQVIPLLDFGLPPGFDPGLEGNAFADWFVVLNPGDYEVTATPLSASGEPSQVCAPTSGTATVFRGETTELLLVSQCSAGSGALDVTVTFDSVPFIEELEFRPSKFTCSGDPTSMVATATDADGDPLTYEWQVIAIPDAATDTSYCLGYVDANATFSAVVAGRYELLLSVSDGRGVATLRFPIYVNRCPVEECPGDQVRDALPDDPVLAGGCTCEFEPFDPNTDWPSGDPEGGTEEEELGCLPPTQYNPDTLTEEPRDTGEPCPDSYCIELTQGFYVPASEEDATQPGCEAFNTEFCVPDVGSGTIPLQEDGTRLGCDSAPALGPNACEQVEICPDPGDVPANASQSQDPPTFPELEPLPPPDTTVPSGVITLADNLTRFVPPCYWNTLQNAARVFAAPVPAWGDNDTGRIDAVPPNFSGSPLGASCIDNMDCRSNLCTTDPEDEFGVDTFCFPRERLNEAIRRDPNVNPTYWDPPPKGSDRWNVDFEGGPYAADVHVQGAFYPSVAWDINAGGDFRMDVTAAGASLDRVVYIDATARNSNCGWGYNYEVRLLDLLEDFDGFELGVGGLFVAVNGLGQASGSNDDGDAAQCRNALATLRDQEEETNRRLWDTMFATALWNNYGPSDAVPSLAALDQIRGGYEDAVDEYVSDLVSYETQTQAQSQHAFGVDVADLDAGLPLWRPKRVGHRMGPFVVGTETSVVGKVGVDVLLKSATDFAAEPGESDVAVGIEVTPRADVLGYMAVYGGIDIFIASVEVGLQGELQFGGLYLPVALSGGLVRDEVPIDQTSFGSCIDDDTIADFVPAYNTFLQNGGSGLPCPDDPGTTGLPVYGLTDPLVDPSGAIYRAQYGYNVGVQGRILDGAIKAFVRARLLLLRKTWKKTLVEWEGFQRDYLTISGGDIFADSFNTEIGSVTLPVIGTSVDLWPGPQRDMVYLPDFSDAAGPAGNRPQSELLYALLNDNLQDPDRWETLSGLCGVFVP